MQKNTYRKYLLPIFYRKNYFGLRFFFLTERWWDELANKKIDGQ